MLNKHEASFILFAFYQAYNLEKNFFLLAVFSLGRHLRRMSLRRMLLLGTCRHENKAYYTPDEYVETNELIMNCECARPKSTIKRPRVVLFFPFFFLSRTSLIFVVRLRHSIALSRSIRTISYLCNESMNTWGRW